MGEHAAGVPSWKFSYERRGAFELNAVIADSLGPSELAVGITCAYDAAQFLLGNSPEGESGSKLETARGLMKYLAGECSAAVARVHIRHDTGEHRG